VFFKLGSGSLYFSAKTLVSQLTYVCLMDTLLSVSWTHLLVIIFTLCQFRTSSGLYECAVYECGCVYIMSMSVRNTWYATCPDDNMSHCEWSRYIHELLSYSMWWTLSDISDSVISCNINCIMYPEIVLKQSLTCNQPTAIASLKEVEGHQLFAGGWAKGV